jgi:lysophospholipase L1-like esterase
VVVSYAGGTVVRIAAMFGRTHNQQATSGRWSALKLTLVLVYLSVNGIGIASAQVPGETQKAVSSCDAQAAPLGDQPPAVTGVYMSAAKPPGSRPGTTMIRDPIDWPWLCRYRADNQAARSFAAPDVVFFGDSITENWAKADADFFDRRLVNRGIGGQTSSQLLLRFYQDVVTLRPKAVHIIVGTNDVAGNPGALDAESYKNNLLAMTDLAKAHNIRVILGSVPPAANFPWRQDTPWRERIDPVGEIRALNLWLRQLAKDRTLTFVDYYGAMAASDGSMREALTRDGVHPNGSGYELMRGLALASIASSSR